MEPHRVLVADDQPDVLDALRLLLERGGFEVRTAASPRAALAELGGGVPFDVLLMDLNYARDTTSGAEGLELVTKVRQVDPDLPIVIMTGWATVPVAVATMREGAVDFVEKPWDNRRLLAILRKQVDEGRRRRRAHRLSDDALDVQRRLLGPPSVDVEGFDVGVAWRFAEPLGGDAWEIVPLSGGRLAVAIADVCGKGTPAALLMVRAHALLGEAFRAAAGPRATCARLNDALASRLAPERYVTLVCAVLDPRAGTLSYANAGHPPPLLLRADGAMRRLERGGPVLGVVPGADYEEGVLALRPGDRLVMTTDGVSEAVDLAAMDGELRIEPAQAAADGLVRIAAAAGEIHDDATAVVVGVSAPARG